ncbi:hypothetical protein PSHT_11545 [Puccinia striiformis]|uniref:Wax synthase domain-containing protein n=1 Tax=Puccinia striiformis TaxID=27350 RepID=A0A2S4V2M4_9BASI|nr:hypothetical protein PSHT_11545 [Puccinia striiformis]
MTGYLPAQEPDQMSLPSNEFDRMIRGYTFILPLLLQAYLLTPTYPRSRGAKLARIGLLPISLYLNLTRLDTRLFFPTETFFHLNLAVISVPTFHAACLSVQLAFFNQPIFASKDHLVNVGNYRGDPESKEDNKKLDVSPNPRRPSFLEKIKFTIWILTSPRGLETSWAPSLEVVPLGPIGKSAGKFGLHILGKIVFNHIVATILWMAAVQCVHHPHGPFGVLADHIPGLGFLKNYNQFDYLMPALFGPIAMISIDTLGCFFNLIEVILVYQLGPHILPKGLAPGKFDSSLYPPLFNNLLGRDSLISFWSKGWHAIFRRHIIVCGWIPMEYIFTIFFGKQAAKMGGIMGAMIFSGIFHEFLVAAVSRIDPSFPTVKMFALSGIGMLAEVQFKRQTGRLVNGLPGRIWAYIILGFYGKYMIESWVERGLGRSDVPLPRQWTWPRFVIPFSAFLPERWITSLAS